MIHLQLSGWEDRYCQLYCLELYKSKEYRRCYIGWYCPLIPFFKNYILLMCFGLLFFTSLFYININTSVTIWISSIRKTVRVMNLFAFACRQISMFLVLVIQIISELSADVIVKACVRNFSLFLKDKCISSLFRTKYIEKKFNLQLFFLPTVSRTFILSWATTRYPPPWNFLFRKSNCMCNRDNARDGAACPDE